MTRTRFLLGLLVAALLAFACTPAQRAELAPAVAPLEHDACVGLRAAGSSVADDVCATADELAPFVSEILAARAAAPQALPPSHRLLSMPAPKHPAARARRTDAGAPAEAGIP